VHFFAFCFVEEPVDPATRRRLQIDGRKRLASVIARIYQSKKTVRDLFEPPQLA